MSLIGSAVVGALSAIVVGSVMLAPTVAATDRIPVTSLDDTGASIASRIAAVDNVVVALDARLERIIGAFPAGPPVIPIADGLRATRQSLGTIVGTVDSRLCTQDAVIGTGDASLADGDVFASDTSSTGLVNQLSSVRAVASEANARLIRIYSSFPPGPPVDEVRTALLAVRSDAVAGFEAITSRIADAAFPPSPCFTT
jgi:hypothetical protein